MEKTAIALLASLVMVALAGRNTVRGVGQDVEAAGEEIEETANEISVE